MMKIPVLSACISLLTFSALAADISVQETALGQVYSDSNGMTLYYFANDKPGQSNCNNDCAKLWPPLLVDDQVVIDQASLLPPSGKIKREDGTQQWTLNHRPLYLWHKDQLPGDITGAGFKNLWSLARADSVPVNVYTVESGRILTNEDNMSLYTFSKDSNGVSACYADCATNWPPLTAQKEDMASGSFSVVARTDGTYQWAYEGKPLYTWMRDKQPGDITGDKMLNLWSLAYL